MKPKLFTFLAPIAFLAAVAINPLLGLLLLTLGGGSALGVSYTQNVVQTATGIVAAAPNDREQAWGKKILMGAYNLNVFADNMIGPEGSGKAFIDCTGTRNVKGNTFILTNVFQLGGPGAQGETERNGKEENITPEDQGLKWGRQWYGMGVTTVAQAETIVGSEWDRMNSPMLEQRVGHKKSTDMQIVLRESSSSDNTVFPNGKTLATLKTADTFQTSVITKAGIVLSGNGANPMLVAQDPKRGRVEGYTFIGAHTSISSLYSDSVYLSAVENAGVRGMENPVFSGRYSDWNGHFIHPIQNRRRGTKGPVGSPLERIAFLGIAIAANDTGVNSGVITGGGATTTAGNEYFENFDGFAYKLCSGLAPDAAGTAQAGSTLTGTGSIWYVAIIDKTTGKYSLLSYTGNTGTTLTGVKRLGASATSNMVTTLTSSSMTYSAAAYSAGTVNITTVAGGGALGLAVSSDAVAVGSLIVQVNALGTAYNDTLGLGEQAGVCGYGALASAGSVFGRRTKQVTDNEKDVTVGFEFAFGCKAYTNPDNVATNYVRIIHAVSVDGLPAIV